MIEKLAYMDIGGVLFNSMGFFGPFLLEPTLAACCNHPRGQI